MARGIGIDPNYQSAAEKYKTGLFNQYQNIAAQSPADLNRGKLSYTDSPIFNRGYEAWNPSSIGSGIISNYAIPVGNLISKGLEPFTGDYTITSGKAGGIGGPTAAGFASNVVDPILSGTATPKEKLDFAGTFGHEMGHLGWQYKPKDERISVGGKTEGGGLSALMGSVFGDYAGDEQWNYMHDLMYAPRGYSSEKYMSDVENLRANKENMSPDEFQKQKDILYNKFQGTTTFKPGEMYLTDKGLINKGDLSYTPKAHDVIAWSGLTSADKKAIGFGVNPFEDTRAAGQWNQIQQQQKKKNQILAWQKMKQKQMAPPGVFPRGYVSAADVARKKAAAAKQASLQAQVTTQANKEARERVSRGEAKDYGKTETRASSGWESSPFEKGGLVDLYRYGGFSG